MSDPGVLYSYDIWNTRRFFGDTLKSIFQDLAEKIDDNLDPGEYGIQSYYCRLLCIATFVLQIADEFQNIKDLVKLLWRVPTEEGHWVEYDNSTALPESDPRGDHELQKVTFQVAGMPMRWKIVIAVTILIPRIFIWRMLSMAGVHFIMETASMVGQIVNTTALSFVLSADELIQERLAAEATKHIVEQMQDYHIYDHSLHEDRSDQDILDDFQKHEMKWSFAPRFPVIPWRFVWTVVFMVSYVFEYYWHTCTKLEDGSWASVPVALPTTSHMKVITFFKMFVSFHEAEHGEGNPSFWKMPQ